MGERARWEIKTTWGEAEPPSPDSSVRLLMDPLPPEGEGWEPFAAGVASPFYRVDRYGCMNDEAEPAMFTAWRRRVVGSDDDG